MTEIVWREVLTDDYPPRYVAFDGGAKVGSVSQNAGTAAKFWRWYGAWAAHGNSGRSDSRRGAMIGLERALAGYLERTPNAKGYLPYRLRREPAFDQKTDDAGDDAADDQPVDPRE